MPRKTRTDVYYDRNWRNARAIFLQSYPLCKFCYEIGTIRKADLVDHIKPHKGDYNLFWDRKNWQALCTDCHVSIKAKIELGQIKRIGLDGWPMD